MSRAGFASTKKTSEFNSRPATPVAAAAPAPAKKNITPDMVAKRAYEIYLSGKGGSEKDNWYRAERELRAA